MGALTVSLLLSAAPAHASIPSTIQNNTGTITDYLQRGGATTSVPTPTNPTVVDDLWLSEHRSMPNQVSSDALHSELRAMRTKIGVLPKLGAAAGNVALGAGVFQVGWMIGTGIRQKFLGLDGSAQSTTLTGNGYNVTATKMYPVTKGQCAQGGGTSTGATTCPTPLAANSTVIPADGWIAQITSAPYGDLRQAGKNCPNGTSTGRPPEYLFPAGFIPLTQNVPDTLACTGGGSGTSAYMFKAAKVKKAIATGDGQTTHITATAPADVSRDLAQQRFEDELASNPGDYPTLIPWLDSQLGGTSADPTAATLVIPQVQTDEQYGAYAARLTDLGLSPTRENLAAYDPDFGPDRVISTSPPTGSRVPTGTEVKVTTNPPTAPELPSTEGPDIPSINFDPLLQAGTCENFPFGVPCWIYDTIANFVGSPVTPELSFHFPYGGEGNNTTISMEMFDPYMPTVRTIIGIGACTSMLWLFYGLAFGGAIGGGRNDGSK